MTSDPVERYLSARVLGTGRRARLRPMTNNEIMDQALGAYRALGWSFLRLAALPSLFCLAAVAFFTSYVVPALMTTRDPGSAVTQVTEAAFLLGLAVVVGGPLFMLGVTYTAAMVVHLVSDHLLQNDPLEQHAVDRAVDTLPRLLLVLIREGLVALGAPLVGVLLMFLGGLLADVTAISNILPGLLSLLGVLLTIVGSVIFLALLGSHALVVPVAVLERRRPGDAVSRSKYLMRASHYHPPGSGTVTSLYALMFLIALVIYGGSAITFHLLGLRAVIQEQTLGMALQPLIMEAIDLVPAYLMIWSLVPVWATTVTVIYYERRIRLEGFDIDVLAAQM